MYRYNDRDFHESNTEWVVGRRKGGGTYASSAGDHAASKNDTRYSMHHNHDIASLVINNNSEKAKCN